MNSGFTPEHVHLIYLLYEAVNDKPISWNDISSFEFDKLYQNSHKNMVTSVVYRAISKSGIYNDTTLFHSLHPDTQRALNRIKEKHDKAIVRTISFNLERERIFDLLTQKGIWHMPLKGILLQEYYPEVGLREMSDNDILFDKTYCDEVKCIMKQLGYSVVAFGDRNEDAYRKAPIFNFEFHRELFEEQQNGLIADYYQDYDIKFADSIDKQNYLYHMNDNDMYVYFIAHAYKHFSESGTGLRVLLDIHLYLKKKEEKLDFSYISEECNKMGICNFEVIIRGLSNKIFGDTGNIETKLCSLLPKEEDLLLSLCDDGIYGNVDRRTANGLSNLQSDKQEYTVKTKLEYIFKRLFKNREWMMDRYPILKRLPFFIPFVAFGNMLKRIWKRRKQAWTEFKKIIIAKKN